MHDGLHYPDNLYADHEERKARRSQAPTGAYRAPAEIPESERKLRTALAYVNHARDLIRDALGDNEPKVQREAKIAYDVACDEPSREWPTPQRLVTDMPIEGVPTGRVPKWDVRWGKGVTVSNGLQWNEAPPNCMHPMHAETIRDHDERLKGAEDKL